MNWLSEIFGFFKSFQFWIVVAPWESALRIRLGRTAEVLSPGPHWRIPFVDRLFVQSVRLRTITDSGQTVTTRDGKTLTISLAVSYAIEDISKLYGAVSNPECTLFNQIQGGVAKIVSQGLSGELTKEDVETGALIGIPTEAWGLGSVRLVVTSFVYSRAFRLLNEYQMRSEANCLT